MVTNYRHSMATQPPPENLLVIALIAFTLAILGVAVCVMM